MSLVSIAIVTYNQDKYIAETLNGILKQQTTFDFEIVIGEDFSTDQTRAICEAYKKEHSQKIKLLPSPKNFGVNPNFVRTVNACTGKYIAICDGDDYWTDPLKLQKQVDIFESNPSIAMVYSDAATLTDGILGEFYKGDRPRGMFDLNTFLYQFQGFGVPTSTGVLRSDAIKAAMEFLLPNADKVISADFVMWSIAGKFGNYHFLDEKTAVYRKHNAGIMGTLGASRVWFEAGMYLNHALANELGPSTHAFFHGGNWWYYMELSFLDLKEKKWGSSLRRLVKSLVAAGKSGKNNRIQILRNYLYRLRQGLSGKN